MNLMDYGVRFHIHLKSYNNVIYLNKEKNNVWKLLWQERDC